MMNLFSFTKERLKTTLDSLGEKPFRATQLFEWIYKRHVFDFQAMKNISKQSQALLASTFTLTQLKLETVQTSSDGTQKFLFQLDDGHFIETVLMRYSYGNSVCISSQVGCNMGCAFCASGLLKRKRHLDVHEMVLQVLMVKEWLMKTDEVLSHIVIMGIGEPFDNYDNTIDFIKIVNDHQGLDIGARHITVSTCGIVPRIIDFAHLDLQVNLAISLHFPNDALRNKYMPINKTYPLKDLFEALRTYFDITHRRITFEYILMDGINDSLAMASELVGLLRGMNCYVNLIPMNETKLALKRSKQDTMNQFYDFLARNHIQVTLRREQGHDIDAACGQLRNKREAMNEGTNH